MSSNVSDEMTEVCCVDMLLLEIGINVPQNVGYNLNGWLKKKKKLDDTLIVWFICIESFFELITTLNLDRLWNKRSIWYPVCQDSTGKLCPLEESVNLSTGNIWQTY